VCACVYACSCTCAHVGISQTSEVNYLWSAANTPFGPFSSSAKLNFALIDAARRNLVFSALNASIAQVSDVLEQFSRCTTSHI